MDRKSLIARAKPLPPPLDEDSAATALSDLSLPAGNVTGPRRDFLLGVMGGSPFLAGLLKRFPEIPDQDPDALLDDLVSTLASRARACDSEAGIKTLLRTTRARAALCIALSDLGGLWDVEKVTQSLTRLADACINAALDWLLADAGRRGWLVGLDAENPARSCGLTVLAMGKHGAGELNFSSDVDLIVLFDPDSATIAPGREAAPLFVRLTKRLVSLLQDITEDGYVYRVDLRLRPDPGATQVAINIDAAMVYYESMGQNWERAAMIKARPAAGDLALGEHFLAGLKPFIWRKYLDFATIAEVHNLKRQINSHKGHGEITVLGHNVKLGRGGIREIEFFVQTQQLIAGGRNDHLRARQTLEMLKRFAGAGWITGETANGLSRAYRFLRTIEHRIQMVADQQTHQLPGDAESFERFARFCGYASGEALSKDLFKTFTFVQECYDALFEGEGRGAGDDEKLEFAGLEDDPATLARLRDIGFANPHAVSKTIKSWYAGRYNALRTATARQRLAEFMPDLLRALARPGNDPDAAFIAFDRFLSGLPSGVQLFSMLAANRHLLDLIARILSCAPRLAGELSRRPRIFDAVIEPGFFENLPGPDTLKELIERTMPPGTAYDIVLDQARIIHREQMFRIGARILSATINADEAASAYSDLAEALVARLLDNARDEMARRHGNIAGSALAVIAMGKLGGREMTATSDLDLIVVYDHEPGAAFSDGEKPLETNRYFARLTQRLVSGLTVPTSEGGLYEVDMRLRPSGNKGPVATSLSSFIEYQKSSAWTWEKMALTRARVIAADPGLEEKLNGAIRSALCQPCDAGKIRADALAMRKVMRTEKPPTGFWDLKNPDGGIIELEFIVQVLQVIHAASCPAILTGNMKKALARLRDHELLAAPKANDLLTALELYQSLSQVLKLGIKGEYRPETAPPGLTAMINRAAATPDIESTMALLKNTRQTVKSIFNEAVAGPARQA